MNDKDSKNNMAFEALMQDNNPLSRKYDSGYDGILAECRECRFHRPLWTYQSCVFDECPYSETLVSTRKVKGKCRG